MQPVTRLLFSIGAVVALAACSIGGAPSPSVALDGRTFLSTAIQGADLVPGTRIRLSFTGGDLSASGGCNIIGGAYTVDAGRLVTASLAMTEMACEEPRMQQDEWLTGLLGGATLTLDGDTLALANDGATLTLFDAKVATPDVPIEGTRWILDGIVSGNAVSSVPAGVTSAIRIVADRVDVETGCNIGGGQVGVADDVLTFGPIALTKRGCEDGPAAVEQAVMAVLSGAVGYSIDADTLTLDTGAPGLIFRAVP